MYRPRCGRPRARRRSLRTLLSRDGRRVRGGGARAAGGGEAALAQEVAAAVPDPAMIDYYGQLHPEPHHRAAVGGTVIFGFRAQAFFARAHIVPIAGVGSGRPEAKGVWTADGRRSA